jgi:hypothetical protein
MSGNPDSIEDGNPHVLGACTVQSHDQLSPLQAADGHVRYPRPFPTALRRRRTAAAPPPGARDCAPRPSTLLLRPASSSPSCSPMSCRRSYETERAGPCQRATSRSYPHVHRTTARAPPAIPPRPWVGSRPVCRHARSRRIRAQVRVACRTATQHGYLQVAARFVVSGCHLSVRSSTSRPLAAAGAFSASSCVSSTAAYAVPCVRNVQQSFPRWQRRSLV